MSVTTIFPRDGDALGGHGQRRVELFVHGWRRIHRPRRACTHRLVRPTDSNGCHHDLPIASALLCPAGIGAARARGERDLTRLHTAEFYRRVQPFWPAGSHPHTAVLLPTHQKPPGTQCHDNRFVGGQGVGTRCGIAHAPRWLKGRRLDGLERHIHLGNAAMIVLPDHAHAVAGNGDVFAPR